MLEVLAPLAVRSPTLTDDGIHMRNVRALGCMMAWTGYCTGRVHAHHAGERPGMARKAADDTTLPLCAQHHADWHSASGPFADLDHNSRRVWADIAIVMVRGRLAPF